ncbi:MAG: 5'-deoxynucleotidase, partial [Oscillospiraceae bacterium]|nr:5'-deoxynucleotidase [Oscillospiraceae bacterium]
MAHHFFAYIARMRFINRWALMRNSYAENIQEHSHMVSVVAHALAEIRNTYFGGKIDAGKVAVAALYHDASEIITGDMPTPIKYYNPKIRDSYKEVEQVACDKLLQMLPEELKGVYAPLICEADEEIRAVVKAA